MYPSHRNTFALETPVGRLIKAYGGWLRETCFAVNYAVNSHGVAFNLATADQHN